MNPDDDFEKVGETDSGNYLTEAAKDNNAETFNVGAVVAGISFGLVMIVLAVLLVTHLSEGMDEFLSNIFEETANTATDEEIPLANEIRNIMSMEKELIKKLIPIGLFVSSFSICLKMIKRILDRH